MKKHCNACLIVLCICIFYHPLTAFSQKNPPVIDFASDTQAPLFVEKAIYKPNHNEKATEMIFNDINVRHPSGLFILGDVVSLGFENKKWQQVDTYLKTLRSNGIPVYAALGNHELMINADKGEKRFQSRFPMHKPSGYVETIDSVAVILLNSNFTKMKPAAIKKQDTWYKNTLHQLDSDASVKFVIVGCHHSPYTNSRVVSPSLAVQQKFVAPFLRSKKCALFLSGHSHNFERFKVEGKQFLVIGGGGGIHQPLYTDKQKTPDISGSYKPMFHYIEVTRLQDSLQISSRQLKSDFTGFKEGLTFTVSK
jgi:predicted MPP superfamily phosphohydrolase